jgi:hypothetical protein
MTADPRTSAIAIAIDRLANEPHDAIPGLKRRYYYRGSFVLLEHLTARGLAANVERLRRGGDARTVMRMKFPGLSLAPTVGIIPSAPNTTERTEIMNMDMRKYYAGYIKVEDLDSPRQEQIEDCRVGNFDRPVLHFESGDKLSLNFTNTRTLGGAFGDDSNEWIGKTIELYVGQVKYQGELQPSVLVRPISPPVPLEQRKQIADDDLDDEVPF